MTSVTTNPSNFWADQGVFGQIGLNSESGRPSNLSKRMCLVIRVYGDDGADEKRERVTAVAVVAGSEEWWQRVEDQWIVRCGGVPFHAKDCECDQGDYKDRPHEENKVLYRDLTGILAASPLGGIGVAIDLAAQKRVFPDALPLAYYKAFLETLQRTATMAENCGEVAELIFDVSTENEYNAGLLYSLMRKGDRELSKWLHSKISFVSGREHPRLQVADLLAYEAWKALDHTVGAKKRRRKSWDLLRATGRFETLSYGQQWFKSLKEHIESGELPKIVGFNQKDYQLWLGRTGRQHNLSNLFTFAMDRPSSN